MRTLIAVFALAVAGSAAAQEAKVTLKEGAGKDKTMQQCVVCHSLDYIPMNSRFLDKKGWTGEVTKMIKVFGARIPDADVAPIVDYLTQNYGKPEGK